MEPPSAPVPMGVPPQTPRPELPLRTVSPTIEHLRVAIARDGATAVGAFWEHVDAVGTPLVESIGDGPDHVAMTWLWRGGDEVGDVVLAANKVVDPAACDAARLDRMAGTDVWHLTLRLGATWRGSYGLAVVPAAGGSPTVADDELADLEARRGMSLAAVDDTTAASRARWFEAMRFRRPDPRTREQLDDSWSVAAAPDAPPQPFLGHGRRSARSAVVEREVLSSTLTQGRQAWTYAPAATTADLPLVVLLDGQDWMRIDVVDTIDWLIDTGATAPFAAIAVSSPAIVDRTEELSCNSQFVTFLADEVVPAARRWTGTGPRTVIAGKSLGGLTALFAAMSRPGVFEAAVALSGSFWWPNTGDPATAEWLTTQVADHGEALGRVHLEVGLQEWVLLEPTRRMAAALIASGVDVQYREVDGGHDLACWRGGLADGLVWTLGARS